MPAMVEAAEESAERLVDGGDLYAASVRPDFVSEAFIRSGGMTMLQAFDDKQRQARSSSASAPPVTN